MRQLIESAAVFVGAVIGAGFLSGQEALQFFVVLGGPLWPAIGLTGLVLALGAWLVLESVRRLGGGSSRVLLSNLAGPWIGGMIDATLSLLVLGTIGVMMAGSGSLFEALHLTAPQYGVLAMGGAIWLLCAIGPRLLLAANTWIVCVLLATALWTISGVLLAPPHGGAGGHVDSLVLPSLIPTQWHGAAIVYAACNLILSVPALGALARQMYCPRATRRVALLGAATLCVLAALVAFTVARAAPYASQLPMLELASARGALSAGLFAVALWLAMLSTGVSATYGLIERVRETCALRRPLLTALLLAAAMPVARLGFAELVGVFYPLIGYAGCMLFVALALRMPADPHGHPPRRKL